MVLYRKDHQITAKYLSDMEAFAGLGEVDDVFGPGIFAGTSSFYIRSAKTPAEVIRNQFVKSDGDHTRFPKGDQIPLGDDLRPAPLCTGTKSLKEILKEGPPEAYGSTTPKTPSIRSPPIAFPAISPDRTPTTNSSLKIDRKAGKSCSASLRRIFSPKTKTTEQVGIGLAQPIAGYTSPGSQHHRVIVTPYDMDGRYGPSTTLTSRNTSSTTPAVVTTPSTFNSPGRIHGKPSAGMVRPVIPGKVTKEHVRPARHPAISKDEIAGLPRFIETSIPDYPMPKLALSRKGKVKRYRENDTAIRIIDFLAHGEIFGRDSALAKYTPPETTD
ncbi:MAG: hypothetical protein Q9170_002372 [Blastenia crenularia]